MFRANYCLKYKGGSYMAKYDNRKNNVERLQQMKENTLQKIEAAEEALQSTEMTSAEKQAVQEKNQHRLESIQAFESEIEDEKQARQSGEINNRN